MTTMTRQIPEFAGQQHHPVTTAALVILFWSVSAILVIAAHVELDVRSAATSAAVTIAAVLLMACGYTRLAAQDRGVTHALGVGIAWLVLSIATEVALTTGSGQDWFYLLGSPDRPLLRNIYLFVWIFAPALFARRASE